MKNININKPIKNNYNVFDANKSFFYVMATNITAPVIFAIFIGLLSIIPFSDAVYNGIVGIIQSVLISLMFLTFIIVYHKRNNINFRNATNISFRLNPLIITLIFVILVLCVVGFFPLINMLYTIIENAGINTSATVGFAMNNWWQLLIGVVIYCVLPAVVEEIIFRGIMLNGMLNRVKPYVAITISALAFFIMHGSLVQSFYQIVLGFVLSLVGYYTKNIVYPIILHFLNNLSVILISYFGIGGFLNGFNLDVGGFFAGVGLMLGCILAMGGTLFLIRYISLKNKSKDYELVVEGNNIIVEDNNQKLGFKQFILTLNLNEKYYFYISWIIAVVLWLTNSFGG